jgi:hypothetical protein
MKTRDVWRLVGEDNNGCELSACSDIQSYHFLRHFCKQNNDFLVFVFVGWVWSIEALTVAGNARMVRFAAILSQSQRF